jgi:hypothetical protein
MLGYDENGNIDWNEVMDMEFEQASKEKMIQLADKQDYAVRVLKDHDKETFNCHCPHCKNARQILGI